MKQNSNELTKLIEEHNLDTVSVVASDLHGVARGKKVPAKRLLESSSSPMRMSNLMAMLDYAGAPFPPPEGDERWWPSWSEGYTDTRAVIDPNSARLVPWQPGTGLVVCDFEHVDGRGELNYMPRATLKRLTQRLADMGYDTKAAIEMEFMLFDETDRSAAEKNYKDLTPLWPTPQAYCLTTLGRHDEVITGIRDQLAGFGLPIETWNVEAGPGQVEMNLPPSEALASADQGFLFKHALKEIAAQKGLYASFISKLSSAGFGNGTHLNFSLWKDGQNAFHSGDAENPQSETLRYFTGGLVKTLREFTLMYAPTVNAYRRFVPYYSTGMMVSWGYDNKSNTVRTVTESPSLCRVEQRTAGGDVNPYLLMAACIAAGLYGIENQIEPPAPTLGDAYADPNLQTVPTTLEEAIELFEQSEVTNQYLGEDFVRFYAHSCRQEALAFADATQGMPDTSEVTGWELARYLEIV